MPRQHKLDDHEHRTERLAIRFTQSERLTVSKKAETAGVCDTDYIRQLALGQSLSAAPRALTVDRLLLSRTLGALNVSGDLLRTILDIVGVGDSPLAETVRVALMKVEMAADAALKALEPR